MKGTWEGFLDVANVLFLSLDADYIRYLFYENSPSCTFMRCTIFWINVFPLKYFSFSLTLLRNQVELQWGLRGQLGLVTWQSTVPQEKLFQWRKGLKLRIEAISQTGKMEMVNIDNSSWIFAAKSRRESNKIREDLFLHVCLFLWCVYVCFF